MPAHEVGQGCGPQSLLRYSDGPMVLATPTPHKTPGGVASARARIDAVADTVRALAVLA